MKKRSKFFGLDQPLLHQDHKRPVTRRDFLAQGFSLGTGAMVGGSMMGLLGSSGAYGNLSDDVSQMVNEFCRSFNAEEAKVPFICFDLAGGANFAGSNVLVGGPGGQQDFLSASGYVKQGLPVDRQPTSSTENFIDESFGLVFHSESQLLAGITEKAAAAGDFTNGAVIAARSENDTGNNPHNPMYLINKAGADGALLSLIGSRSSDSGGNSLAPLKYMDPRVRPTKVDRASDVTGLVDTGDLVKLLNSSDTIAVLEATARLSNAKLGIRQVDGGLRSPGPVNTGFSALDDAMVKDLVRCGYLDSAKTVSDFKEALDTNSDPLDPRADTNIFGDTGIFSEAEYDSDREFRKTAAVMKMVVNGYAGAGTVSMGGYDYHTGDRATGEMRDLRAGRCIGACLEYARRLNKPLMVYVFSDGSVFSNGTIDNSDAGQGKGVWTGDNQQTACSFFLAYDPNGRPSMRTNQLGYMRPSGDVETSSSPVANNVNLLTEAVALNYMAFNGDHANFASRFDTNGLGASIEDLIAFNV